MVRRWMIGRVGKGKLLLRCDTCCFLSAGSAMGAKLLDCIAPLCCFAALMNLNFCSPACFSVSFDALETVSVGKKGDVRDGSGQ